MKTLLSVLLGCWLVPGACAADKGELPGVGRMAPAFTFTTLDGKVMDSGKLKGKVVLLNFFATWCQPCMLEMPRLEKELQQPHRADKNFLILALGREHDSAAIKKFRDANHYTIMMAGDPKRGVYSKFATEGIPRNYLLDAKGRIIFQSVGYEEKDFTRLLRAVKLALSE